MRDLPWLALPAAGERYLADDGPRVHVLLAERDLAVPPGAAADGGLLAVGDPDFDARPAGRPGAAPRRRLPGGCEHAPARLASLPGARAEVRALAAAWTAGASPGPALVLAGADATESRFRALAAGRTALHIATHGILGGDGCTAATPGTRGVGGVALLGPRVAPARAPKPAAPPPPPSPWLGRDAWLAFAGANRVAGEGDDDGWLTADEAVTLDLRGTSLVVLSACQSGVAERWSYDAVLGMRRAFHLAGARCVLASQWPVADDATRAWMEAFYAAAPAPAGAALRHASRTVLAQRRAAGRSTHPFYWAAFTATGD